MTPSDAKRKLAGKIVGGRFELLDLVVSGGMADLYRAVQRPVGRVVAVKLLRRGDAELVFRFRREAEIVSRLRCPHTVTLFDFGEEEEFLYIAMEYLVGETLFDAVGRRGSLKPPQMIDIAGQVLASLQEAHALGVIHRDLKPENVFLVAPESNGGSPGPRSPRGVFAKVLDFGLAKLLVGGKEGVTAAGFTVGTPGYMSPEQLVGGAVDARSDLFSLGVVLYQGLTGSLPYEGMAVLSGIPPKPMKAAGGSVPPAFADLILQALQADPAKRPATALEMLNEVRRMEAALGETAAGPQPSPAADFEVPTRPAEPRALLGWAVEPESARSRLKPAIERAVSTHGGRLERSGGPFGVASFGASQSAVAAGVDVASRALAIRRRTGPIPQVRLAIHHGYIVASGEALTGDSIALLGRVIERCGSQEVLVTRGAFEEAKDALGLDAEKVGVCDSEIGHPIDLFRVAVRPPPASAGTAVAADAAVEARAASAPTPRDAAPVANRAAAPPRLAPSRPTPTSWPSRPVEATPRRSRVWVAVLVFLVAAALGVGAALLRARM